MEFLKTVLIVLLVYLGLKFILKLTWPYLMRYLTKKAGQKFEQSFGQNPFEPQTNKEKEGEVTIERPATNARKSNNTVGEYVDFEEVKE